MLLAALLAAAMATAAVASPLPDGPVPAAEGDEYLLPKNFVPDYYYVRINPHYPLSGIRPIETYAGEVVIEGTTAEAAAKNIVMHKASTIANVEVICVSDITGGTGTSLISRSQTENGDERSLDRVPYIGDYCSETEGVLLRRDGTEEDEETEQFTIKLHDNIAVGRKIRIVLFFHAVFPEGGLTGFYVSSFKTEDGREVDMLTTKFEPTHARKAFPCFDEPALKAKFDLVVTLNNNATDVISNMDEAARFNAGRTVLFNTTPMMSPYLLAFIVFETDSFEATDEEPRPTKTVPYKTWGRSDVIHEAGTLSQIEGPAALEFLEAYTGIMYNDTMPKMDMAAIPDFQSGAMENWGLVTYRESSLLYNEDSHTAAYKRVVDVIAHELVHMWFGNLVTCSWWSSIWLNEGFARYLQYLVVADRYPNWRMLERFVLDEQMGVFASDAAAGAAPLTDDTVKNPTQIGNHFSTISYSKGGAILRQIRNIMGEEHFIEGVRDYLKDRSLKAATPQDLFDNLVKHNQAGTTKLTNAEFTSVLKAWTETPGYPLVTVSRTGGNTFEVSQERFLLIPDVEGTAAAKYPVYLSWTTSKDDPLTGPKPPGDWLKAWDESMELTVEGINGNDWIIFNAYQGGYYRVNYDNALWNQLERLLDKEENVAKVAALDRAALVDNALSLARAGNVSYERAFRVLRFLRHDTDFAPWAAARSALAHLQRMLGQEPAYQEFIAHLVEKAYNETGFGTGRQDAHLDKVHRTNVLSVACGAGYTPCLVQARVRLLGYLAGVIKVDRDLESVVFCYGLKNATEAVWDQLWAKYAQSDAARRAVLITALGCIDHRDVLKKFLGKSLNGEVRSQDAYTVFSSVYSSPEGVGVALDFLTFWGYQKLEDAYGAVRNAMSTLVSGIASRLTTQEQLAQLENAVEEYKERHGGALRTVQGNIDWLEEHGVEAVSETLTKARNYRVGNGAPAAALASGLALACAGLWLLLR